MSMSAASTGCIILLLSSICSCTSIQESECRSGSLLQLQRSEQKTVKSTKSGQEASTTATTPVAPTATCSAYAEEWIILSLLYLEAVENGRALPIRGGCREEFFDFKKTDVEVAAPQGAPEVKAACCTPFADAQCSDWFILVSAGCPSGKYVVGTNSAPGGGSDGTVLNHDKFKELCCVDFEACVRTEVEAAAAVTAAPPLWQQWDSYYLGGRTLPDGTVTKRHRYKDDNGNYWVEQPDGTYRITADGSIDPAVCPGDAGLLLTYGGWSYWTVAVTSTMSADIHAACEAAGLVTPCPAVDGCQYTDDTCVVTVETDGSQQCKDVLTRTAEQLGCSGPQGCPKLEGVYSYRHNFNAGAACGMAASADVRSLNCSVGSVDKSGLALCANQMLTPAPTTPAPTFVPGRRRIRGRLPNSVGNSSSSNSLSTANCPTCLPTPGYAPGED